MGQNWNFYNIDKREEGEKNGLFKFNEFFFYKQGFLVRSITQPCPSPELVQGKLFRFNENVPQATDEKGLLSLPNELLLMILESVGHDPFTLPALAITCHRLFELGRKMVEDLRDTRAAPWASGRVVCLGEHAQYEDVPKTLFTDTERAEIEKSKKANGGDMSYAGIYRLGLKEHNLYFFGTHSLYDRTLYKGILMEGLRRYAPSDRARYHALMGVTYPPSRRNWSLCNGSKKEYVRASEIAKLAGFPDDPQPFLANCRVDLGHALLTRIAWSSRSDGSMGFSQNATTEKLHRGQWAGDRVYITCMDWLDHAANDWTDVSEAVVRDLTEIYKAQYGKRWLEEIKGGIEKWDKHEWFWMQSDGDDITARRGRFMPKESLMGF